MMQNRQTTEFSFDFAERMIDSATLLGQNFDGQNETARAVVYQSCVSIEVSMKSLLEQSGMPERVIRKLSHRLTDLLEAVDSLHENGNELEPYKKLWSAAVDLKLINGSVGLLLTEASKGSTYPNEMRYGNLVECIEPRLMFEMSKVVLDWCKSNAVQLTYVAPLPA